MKTVEINPSLFAAGFRPIEDPPAFLRAMRRRLGKPQITRTPKFRFYDFPHNLMDRASVRVRLKAEGGGLENAQPLPQPATRNPA